MSSTAFRRLGAITSSLHTPHMPVHVCSAQECAHWSHVTEAAPDEIFNTGIRFRQDPSNQKVNLGVGAYRTDDGKPYVLSVVRKAEEKIANNKSLNKEYLDIDGDQTFVKLARGLLFGKNSIALKENRVASAQSLSGTGALRVGSEFIAKYLPKGTTIYYSKPTWGNHLSIFAAAGVPCKPYRYWDAKGRKLDINGMLEDLNAAPNGSVILLHACAHNPTGVDPTKDEWKKIAEVMKAKNQLPFFDSAYQGFASGDLELDAWAINYFVEQGFEMLAAQSFAKNFGLYNDRVGTINIVCENAKQAQAVLSQMKLVIRPNYSNPPAHGARIVSIVLSDPALYDEWKQELKVMSGRIIRMRQALYNELLALKTPGDWKHIITQIGMFSFTGLTPKQCEVLSNKYHIYLLSNGRISMCGLNNTNVKYVAQCMHEAVVNVK